MNKLVILLAVSLAVNTFAATTKKAAKKAPVAKPATQEQAVAKPATEAAATTAQPQTETPAVNPQPAPAPQPVAVSTATAAKADEAAMTGTVDLRPSYAGDAASFRSENYVDLGYKMGDNHFILEQDFNTNLYNPNATANKGMDLQIKDTMLRWKRANVWESADKTYSLSYELRPYLPLAAEKRDNGMITVVRNYAKFAAKVSDAVTLSLWEIPIVHIYSRAECATGCANPAFENRVYLMADWNMTEKLSLSVPLMLNSTRYRTLSGAANSGATSHFVWIYPELDYALTNNYTLGISWYNDRGLMAEDLGSFTLSDGFKSGVTQLVFRATL